MKRNLIFLEKKKKEGIKDISKNKEAILSIFEENKQMLNDLRTKIQ